MSERSTLPPSLDAEIDEALGLLPLVAPLPEVADRVFARLVDHLCEALLHDIRHRHEGGQTDRVAYLNEMSATVVALQERGLLGPGLPPSRWGPSG